MEPIDAATISVVTDALGPERTELLTLLRDLDDAGWALPTECPAYPVKGIAAHILGDDLSLLSRQRDGALPGLFQVAPAEGQTSPFWQAIAREYLERWAHQSQIRRALGRPSLAESTFLDVGIRIVAAAAGAPAVVPTTADGHWAIGSVVLGPRAQAADILTLAHTADDVRALVHGPAELVDRFASRVGRRTG